MLLRFSATLLISSLLYLLAGCTSAPTLPEGALPYFPHPNQLTNGGVTAKYYTRYDQGSDREVNGQIQYVHQEFNPQGQLVRTVLTPALVPTSVAVYELDSVGAKLISTEYYSRGDTISFDSAAGYRIRWDGNPAVIARQNDAGSDVLTVTVGANTTWRDMPAQRLSGTLESFPANGEPSAYSDEELYVAGIGKVYSSGVINDGTYTTELVEQLSPEDIAELRASLPKRIAYIDSADVILHNPDFERCLPVLRTRDYYNATPDITILGKHYTLREQLLPKLDLSTLAGESGYLTLRFVINCRGEIGMITTDESTLDFAPKRFPEEAVSAFAKTFLDAVQSGDIAFNLSKAEGYDYYGYLTLKLRDGDVTDFLP